MKNSQTLRLAGAALVMALVASATVVLPACETVKGAGKDLQNAGQAGSDAIDSAAKKDK